MSKRSSKVRVFVRTRPTDKFAQDMIEFVEDGKVSATLELCLVEAVLVNKPISNLVKEALLLLSKMICMNI